jgi:YVTN family beta-propeller protein
MKRLRWLPLLSLASVALAQQVPWGGSNIPISSRDRVYAGEQYSNTISVIDPSTNKVVASIAVPFSTDGEGQIAVGSGSIWVPDQTGNIAGIDPATNKVLATYPVPPGLAALAFGFDSLWGTVNPEGEVIRVGPTGSIQATIRVASEPRFLAAGPTGIWVLGQRDGAVSRIDPKTNVVTATIPLNVPGEGGCIAAGGGSVWVTMPDTPVTRVDAATDRVLEQYVGEGGDCIGYAFGSVWLSNHQFGDVWRIKP